ncbi:MAG: tetratricopeptide repeat protein [Aggregatilineales bacterium]
MNRAVERETTLPAPPRFLLLLAIGAFIVIVLIAIGAGIFLTSGRRIGALLPYFTLLALIIPVMLIIASIAFRRSLPRYFPIGLLLFFMVVGGASAFGAIIAYRDLLPPRYQEEVAEGLPFMRSFMRPTPEGGIIPTVASSGGDIAPEDLLTMPLFSPTAEDSAALSLPPAEPEPIIAVAETPTTVPSDTPTATQAPSTAESTPFPTEISPTPAPTSPPTELGAQNESEAVDVLISQPRRPLASRMYGFRHVQQEWNNCGPANVTMALSHFGWQRDQRYAAQYLKPEPEDKNVSPHEMVAFINEQTNIRAVWRYGGTLDLLKDLIAANFPIIVETAYTPEGYDWIGHYQTVVGYDDTQRVFYIYDSFLGAGENGEGIAEAYSAFDQGWQAFNRVFIVLYEPSREATVSLILGEHADPVRAAEIALATAQQEARANPQDAFAWFNMGTSYVRLGRYAEAAAAYDRAIQLRLPFRMLWYQFGPFEAYYNEGRFDDVLSLVQTNLTNGASYVEETHYWQGRVYAAQGRTREAAGAFQRALSRNPRFTAAREALNRLNL